MSKKSLCGCIGYNQNPTHEELEQPTDGEITGYIEMYSIVLVYIYIIIIIVLVLVLVYL